MLRAMPAEHARIIAAVARVPAQHRAENHTPETLLAQALLVQAKGEEDTGRPIRASLRLSLVWSVFVHRCLAEDCVPAQSPAPTHSPSLLPLTVFGPPFVSPT